MEKSKVIEMILALTDEQAMYVEAHMDLILDDAPKVS